MVASVRAVATTTSVSPANVNFVLNKPTGVVTGDILVAAVCLNAASGQNLTPPTGWTRLYSSPVDGGTAGTTNTTTYQSLYVYWRAVDGTEAATFTFQATVAATGSGNIIGIQGADTTAPFSIGTVFLENPGPSSYTTNTTNLTTTETSLLVSFYAHDSGSLAITPPTNMTSAWNNATGQKSAGSYLDNAAAGSTTITWSTATATKNSSWSGGVKSAGAGSTPITGSESNSLAVSDTSSLTVVATKTAAESNSLAVSDTSSLTVVATKSAAESNSLALTESNVIVPSSGSGTAPTYVGKVNAINNVNDVTALIPTGTQGGDLLIVAIVAASTQPYFPVPANWTSIGLYDSANGDGTLWMFQKIAAGSVGSATTEPANTVFENTGVGDWCVGATYAFRGVNQTTPTKATLGTTNTVLGTTHNIAVNPSYTDPVSTMFYVVGGDMQNTTSPTWNVVNGYTEVDDRLTNPNNTNTSIGAAYKEFTSYSLQNFNITSNSNTYGIYGAISILPSAGAGTNPSSSDNAALSVSDASALFITKPASDTTAISVTEASAVTKSATDTTAISVADTSSLAISLPKTASDTSAISVSDASSAPVVGAGKTLPAAVDTDEVGVYIEPESLGHNPPFIDTNGNLYKAIEHEDASQPWTLMLKSADGGQTWHIQNGAVRPTSQIDLEGTWTEQVGNKIYFAQTQDSNDPITVTYFRTSDHPTNPDTWSGVYWTLTPYDTSLSQSAQYQWVSINHLSTGEWWAFYHDNKYVKVGAGDSGTPGTYNNLVMTFPMPVTGQNDVTHIVYTDIVNNQVLYRTLSATGTMSAATRIDATGRYNPASNTYACHSNVMSVMNGGTETICVLYAEANAMLWLATITGGSVTRTQISTAAVSSRSSVPSGITTSGNIDTHIAKDPANDTLYLVWMDQADGKLYYRTRTAAGTLSAITLLYDPPGVANTSSNSTGVANSEAWYPFPNIYSYPDGTKVMGYTVDLGWHLNSVGNVKYNEMTLSTGGGTTPVVGSETPSVSVSETSAVVVSLSASQSNSLAVTDTSALSGSSNPVGFDSAVVSVSETTAGSITAVASQSNSLAITETSAVAQQLLKTASDTGALAVTDVNAGVTGVNALGSSDTGSISVADSSVRSIGLNSTDTTAIAVADTSSVAGAGSVNIAASQSNALAVTETSLVTTVILKTATDTTAVSVTDSSSKSTVTNTVTGNFARYIGYAVNDKPDGLWALDNANGFFDFSGYGRNGSMLSGTPGTSVAVASGFANSAVYQNTGIARFPTQAFKQGNEAFSFTLEGWVLPIVGTTTAPQAILSHTGQYDGLTINGTVVSFTTKYLTAAAAVLTYDLQSLRAAYVVGMHTNDKNMLYVNGEMVAEIQLTDAQRTDRYIATDGYLYCGQSTSDRKLAVNALAVYNYAVEGERISVHYVQGRKTVTEIAVPPIFGGTLVTTHAGDGTNVYTYTYSKRADWKRGYTTDTAFHGNDLIPMNDTTDTSLPGTWVNVYELDSVPEAQLNGVSLIWDGIGATISASLDGATWETAVNGKNLALVTPGFNPADRVLHIRVTFAGGVVDDPAYLDSLTVVVQASAAQNNTGNRTITVGQPAYRRIDAEPLEYRTDWGLELGTGGTLTIGPDTSSTPMNPRTIEMWVYRNTATNPTINQTGTVYRQGASGNLTFTQGEWTLVHIVTASAVTGNIVITGPAIIGHVALYGTALSQSQSLEIYQSYTGIPRTVSADTSVINVSEPSDAAKIYTFDWSIQSAG